MTEILMAKKSDVDALSGTIGSAVQTASNQGTVGTGPFKGKVGTDLQFYKLNAASARASIVLNGTDRIDFDVVEAQINIGALTGSLALGQIPNALITYAKVQNVAATSLLGNPTGAPAAPSEISLGADLEFSAGVLRAVAYSGGDITKAAGAASATVNAQAITYAKIQNISATARLLGRVTAGAGSVEEISLAADHEFNTGALRLAAFSGGDIAKAAGATSATINNAAVTLAKIQNAVANSKLLGSGAAGSGSPYSEITLGTGLSMSGTTLNAAASSASFRATTATAQSLTANTWVKVQYDTETFDTASNYDPITNFRHTPTTAGKYRYSAQIRSVMTKGARLRIALYKNGSAVGYFEIVHTGAGVDEEFTANITDVIDMNGSTDYVEVFAFCSDASPSTLDNSAFANFFAGELV